MKPTLLPFEETKRQLEELWQKGKCREALELAKTQAKLQPQARDLVLEASRRRILQLAERGAASDALAMLKLTLERFPQAQAALLSLQIDLAAATGDWESLLKALTSSEASLVEVAETAIKKHLTDLSLLANTKALPSDHPLCQAARDVQAAFKAVTSGPVTEELLPAISRRHPLAGWKLLIRAIAALYREDHPNVKRALETLDDSWAVARFKPLLKALIGEKGPPLAGQAGHLQTLLTPPTEKISYFLGELTDALMGDEPDEFNPMNIFDFLPSMRPSPDARKAAVCFQQLTTLLSPETSEHHRHIERMARVLTATVSIVSRTPMKVLAGSRLDATFWRYFQFLSRGKESPVSPAVRLFSLERMNAHGLEEGLFKAGSAEQILIFKEILRILRDLMALDHIDDEFGASYVKGVQDAVALYDQADPTSRKLQPDAAYAKELFSVNRWFDRLQAIAPDAQEYQAQMDWMTQNPEEFGKSDIKKFVARWTQAFPLDPAPLMIQADLYRSSNALGKANEALLKAWKLAPGNSRVLEGLIQVTMELMMNHFRQRKAHLVEADRQQLAQILQLQGRAASLDDQAWLGLLRRLEEDLFVLPSEPLSVDPETHWGARVTRNLRYAIQGMAGRNQDHPVDESVADERLALDILKFQQLNLRFHLRQPIPPFWWLALEGRVKESHLSSSQWLELGELAAADSWGEIAYFSSAKVLPSASGAMLARALWLRSKSLPPRSGRVTRCRQAATLLARQVNDQELLEKLREPRDSAMDEFFGIMPTFNSSSEELSEAEFQSVLAEEIAATEFAPAVKTRRTPTRKAKPKTPRKGKKSGPSEGTL